MSFNLSVLLIIFGLEKVTFLESFWLSLICPKTNNFIMATDITNIAVQYCYSQKYTLECLYSSKTPFILPQQAPLCTQHIL